MPLLSDPGLSQRDAAVLKELKSYGLCVVEVRINQFSPVCGHRLEGLKYPEKTRAMCVIRNTKLVLDLEAVFLEEGDIVYLITENEEDVRVLFTVLI